MLRLDPDELSDLGDFLSRRLPSPSPLGWEAALTEAQARGRLGALLADASKTCDDPRLREVRALLQPRRGARAGIALAAAAAAVFAVASVVVVGGVASAALTADAPPRGLAALPPSEAVAPVEGALSVAPAAEVAPLAPPVEVAAASTRVDPPCARAGEGVVGWWYAGERAPGAAGDAITMTRDANVRVSAPGADNRFNARTRVACVLHRGDRLVLSEEALRVPPGVYWVPVRATDLR